MFVSNFQKTCTNVWSPKLHLSAIHLLENLQRYAGAKTLCCLSCIARDNDWLVYLSLHWRVPWLYFVLVQYERFIRPAALRFKKAHITHPELQTTFHLDIIGVKKNPQSPLYTALGVITKGSIIEACVFVQCCISWCLHFICFILISTCLLMHLF